MFLGRKNKIKHILISHYITPYGFWRDINNVIGKGRAFLIQL
jgi:hypothetical protein